MSETNIKFSIAIPAYKKKFLKECIDSILSQTYQNFEIVIVNDNSPEDLDSVIYLYNHNKIRYYKNKVGYGSYNVVGNWNKCLEYATGDYIICMGDDDKLLPYCLEQYAKLIDKYPTLDIYHTRAEIINEKSQVIDLQEPRPEYESVYSSIWYRWNGRKQFIGDFLFKTDYLRLNGGFYNLPTGCCSDEISVWIAAEKKGIANTLNFGFQYRDNSQTISRNQQNMRDKIQAFKIVKEWYKSFLIRNIPNNHIDEIYRNNIAKNLDGYIYQYYIYCTKVDINQKGIKSIPFWIKNRKQYNLNPFFIISCLFK